MPNILLTDLIQSEITISGYSGTSGYSGAGTSGYSGFSGGGTSGYSGESGISGFSGYSGINGISGYSGAAGPGGTSVALFEYNAETTLTSGDPGTGKILWNNSTQTSATQLNVNHITNDAIDIDIFLALLQQTETVTLQDKIASANYQTWLIIGTPVNNTSYWTIPVALQTSGGTGTTNFPNNQELIFTLVQGISGFSGTSGMSGFSGISGYSGIGVSGYSGVSGLSGSSTSGYSGTSGLSGSSTSGYSGTSGLSGYSGTIGLSGYSGVGLSGQSGYSGIGVSGYSGISGLSGVSGYSGLTGVSGYSGLIGASGYSGLGLSGYSGTGGSGYSGLSGYSSTSGYSGISGISGFSGIAAGVVKYNISGPVVVNTGTLRWYPPNTVTVAQVYFNLSTTGSSTTEIDVLKNGISIFGTKPTVGSGVYRSTNTTVSVTMTSADYLTFDVTQAGTGAADGVIYCLYY